MPADLLSPDGLSLQMVLRRMSAHLDHLAGLTHEVEQAVAEELVQGAPGSATGSVGRLQNLDFLRQYTEDLALMTHFIGQIEGLGSLDPAQTESIGKRLQLERTRALFVTDPEDATTDDDRSSGEVHLF